MNDSRAALFLLALAGLSLSVLDAQSRKLNGELAPLAAADGGNRIFETVLGPDGQWLVYRADPDLAGAPRLFAVPTDGSAVALPLSAGDVRDFRIAPAGDRVAFRDLGLTLWLAPLDGGAPATTVDTAVGEYRFTPDGSALAYEKGGLRVVPVGGGSTLLVAPAGDTFEITSDGVLAVYRVRTSTGFNPFEAVLWSVPLDGSAAPTKLTPGFAGDLPDFRLAPDGSSLVFSFEELLIDQGAYVVSSLYTVRLDAPPSPARISHAPGLPTVDAHEFVYRSDSTGILFRATDKATAAAGLYAVDFGGSRLRLSAPPVSGTHVVDFALSADDQLAVYRLDPPDSHDEQLFRVPTDGSASPEGFDKLGITSFALTADSARVVFGAQDATDAHPLLYGADLLDPSAPSKRLGATTFEHAELRDFRLAANPSDVVYAARHDSWAFELFRVDASGDFPPVRLSADFPEGGNVESLGGPAILVDPTGQWIVYLADQVTDELPELFAVPPDASLLPRRLNPVLPPSPSVGIVRAFVLEPDGQNVLFEADGGRSGINELYRVPRLGGPPPVRLNTPLDPGTRVQARATRLSPDGRWAVYRVEQENEFSGGSNAVDSVDLWSAGPPRRLVDDLSPSVFPAFELSPDSTRLAYTFLHDAYTVPLDGSSPSLLLETGLVAGISAPHFTADGLRLVYSGIDAGSLVRELFSAPVDGSAAPARIGTRVRETTFALEAFRLGDDDRVAFLADADVPGRFELYGVDASGGSPWKHLGRRPVTGGDVTEFTLAGPRAVYLADEDVDGRMELYSTPLRPGPRDRRIEDRERFGHTKLSGSFATGNPGGLAFLVTPQGDRVVYLAQQASHASLGLYSVPIDGSTPTRRLCPAEPSHWGLTPDGNTVVYVSTHLAPDVHELFSIPLDRSRGPERLSSRIPGGDVAFTDPTPFRITPDGQKIVYRGDLTVDERFELYRVDLEGSAPSVTVSGPLVEGGDVAPSFGPFRITPDGQEVLYLADQERDGIVELFASPLP